MAIRYTCDGCGRDLPAGAPIDQHTVTIELRSAGARLMSEIRHLCTRCFKSLPDQADPANWKREATPPKEATHG